MKPVHEVGEHCIIARTNSPEGKAQEGKTMSLWAWLDLEDRDIFAFTVAGVLGFLLGRMLPPGPIAVFTSMLVSYHLFLAWLVLTAEHESGSSMRS
jgi:hypothetical protein